MPNFNVVPEYNIPAPTNSNRVWLMPDGTTKRVGVPTQETDLDRIRKEAEGVAHVEVFDTDAK